MVKFDQIIQAEILTFQLVNFDYFIAKNDHSLFTFNFLISHLQLTLNSSQIWLKFSSWNFNISISRCYFLGKNDYLSGEKKNSLNN